MLEVPRKSFRIKGLGQSQPTDTSTESPLSLAHPQLRIEPDIDYIPNALPKSYPLGFTREVIISLVEKANGLTGNQINHVLQKVVKRGKFINPPDVSLPPYRMLMNLVNEGVLTRIKINKTYHYFLRVD